MPYQNILLIGGSGFVGSHIAAELAKRGKKLTITCRRRDKRKNLITLPTVDLVQANIYDEATLDKLMVGADAVINLVGILHGSQGKPYGKEFKQAHVDLSAKIVSAATKAGIHRLLHMSALGVSDNRAPSMYLRSKADGEKPVRQSNLQWTIFRPSVIFGADDNFLNMFAKLAKCAPVLPIAGKNAHMQPIYVGDVAQAFANALDNPNTFEKTYELAGPEVFTLGEIVSFAAAASGHPRPVLGLPSPAAYLQALILELAPGPTLMSRDNLGSLAVDNVSRQAIAPELGITPSPMKPIALDYLKCPSTITALDNFRAKAHR